MEYPVEGTCQCGGVRYKLYEAPLAVLACHCTECQKLSTSPFSVTAVIDSSKIEFEGELSSWERTAESGNRNEAHFCPNCGNRVYHINPDEPSTVKLKLKPVHLEDDSIFEPKAHVWTSEKIGWYQIPAGMKVFPKQPQ
ncbi:GFA family protein [Vibrio sp. RE86]|uniref:GFA family protein n=1 Tax=Vibrio sp. RE86 TaxID=2607605 RepID=UPI001493A9A7|nr:GFA family protein [Vibrio sp. RE86]NOH82063.1 GFA family protein [Vibrio sp. RE86]